MSHPAAFRPSMPLFSNLSATSTFIATLIEHKGHEGHKGKTSLGPILCVLCVLCVSYEVDKQPVSKFGLEPRRLRRHDRAGVGHCHQVRHADGIQRETGRGFSCRDEPFELAGAALAADE